MARRALAALALGAALALTACGEELPLDEAPSAPSFDESLEELVPDLPTELPTDVASEVMEIAPDVDPTELLGKLEEACRQIEEGKEEETLARDIAELFGVEEADGATLAETIEPHCGTIG
ncbi:hypothetical protein [Glycomyces tenuis]|uniref:hypothetical protein n=1 Tax=Glycomyces tenuis TaxID=58116 RepID=UPI0004053F51|nr:hypothetical protein [Glycomyces tenuis]